MSWFSQGINQVKKINLGKVVTVGAGLLAGGPVGAAAALAAVNAKKENTAPAVQAQAQGAKEAANVEADRAANNGAAAAPAKVALGMTGTQLAIAGGCALFFLLTVIVLLRPRRAA